MKVRWTLFDLDYISKHHLRANLEYWKWDLVFEARKMIKRIEQSRTLKVLSVSKNVDMMVNLAKSRAELGADDIDAIVKYKIQEPKDGDNNVVVLTLSVDPGYFSSSDVAKAQLGRRASRILKVYGRQELISGFEDEFSKLYTDEFFGEILEDDGVNLHVRKKA